MTPARLPRSLHDQAGMIGKIALLWIVGLLLAGVLILDALSIVLTTFKLSNTAQAAASTAATTYKNLGDVTKACDAAELDVLHDNLAVPQGEAWCKVNATRRRHDLAAHDRLQPRPRTAVVHRGLHEDLGQGDRRAVVVVACSS